MTRSTTPSRSTSSPTCRPQARDTSVRRRASSGVIQRWPGMRRS
jgi:hypothetical protein